MSNIERLPLVPASSKIAEEDVSVNRLASILAAAVVEHGIDEDGDIYAFDGLGCPVWISVDMERKFLVFTSYFPAGNETMRDARETVNDLNGSFVFVQFHWDPERERVWGFYYMTFDGGLDARQFVKMLRHFCRAFVLAFEEMSSDRLSPCLES